MSVEVVGEVRCSSPYAIDWTVSSFSFLCQKKDTRIWSPPFVRYSASGTFGMVTFAVPDSFIELNFYSRDGKEAPVQCVRIGIADINNSVISCCDGEWMKDFSNGGKFKVPKFVGSNILNQYRNVFNEPPRFRLFCEVVNSQLCHVVNVSTQTDNACGKSVYSFMLCRLSINIGCFIKVIHNLNDYKVFLSTHNTF